MSTYLELMEQQQAEVNAFPMFFAFSNEQFAEGMAKFGLTPTDTDKICRLGAGGYCKKSDADAFASMFKRHEKERQAAIGGDSTGDGYILEMFDYELANHEYGYTGDADETLEALGLTMEKVNADPKMLHGFKKACLKQA